MANRIYQPRNAPFDFFAQDGIENSLMRAEQGESTVGTGVDQIMRINLVPDALDTGGKRMEFHAFGTINNAAGGNKRILVQVDIAPLTPVIIFDTGLAAFVSSNFYLYGVFTRRFTSFLQCRATLETNPFTGTSAAVTKVGRSDLLSNFDFTIAHSIHAFGEVANASDVVNVDTFYSSII